MTVTVGLPCEIVDIRVRIAPSSHLTVLEQAALRAVGQGVVKLADLRDLFGLGERLTIDLVQDLWRHEYVRVDVVEKELELAPHVAEIVHDPRRLAELRPARVLDELWPLAVDVVTGQVVPVQRTTGGHEVLVAPRRGDGWTAESVSKSDLLAAVIASRELRYPKLEHAPVILGVELTPRRETGGRTSFLAVPVSVWRDGDGDHARVLADARMAPLHRRRVEEFLAEELDAAVRSSFADSLAARGDTIFERPPTLVARLGHFADRVRRLAEADPGTWERSQAEVVALASEIESELESRESSQASANLVTDPKAQFDAVMEAIGKARKQVVLVGPWIRRNNLQDLLEVLTNAMENGVRVIVGWGFDHADTLDPTALNLLINARDRHPNLLVFSPRSMRTHAKAAICDDRWALVTSLNLLSSEREKIEAGVVVATSGRTSDWTPIHELLRWVRDEFPDAPVARSLLVGPDSFSPVHDLPPARSAAGYPVSPVVPDPLLPEVVVAVRELWSREWGAVLVDTLERHAALPVYIDGLVIDAAHREALELALMEAEQRLIITSDQISQRVVTDRFVARLEQRLRAGVQVRLLYQRWGGGSGEEQARVRGSLQRLAEKHPETFEAREVPGWHAKLLVSDDRVVVSSFNFLSFEGRYREDRQSRRSEMGVALAGGDIADRFVDVACRLGGVKPPPSAPPARILSDGDGRQRTGRECIAAARELASPDADRLGIIGRLSPDIDLGALLGELEASHVSPTVVAEVGAGLVATDRVGPGAGPWIERTLDHLWDERRFVEAMVIRSYPGLDVGLSSWVAEFGAFSVSPLFESWLDTCEVGSLGDAERRSLAIALAVEVLLPQSEVPTGMAATILEDLIDIVPEAAGVARTALDHWRREGPLPQEALERWATAKEHRTTLAELVDEATGAVQRWMNASAPGQDSSRIRGYLNREGSMSGALAEVLADPDGPNVDALAEWHALHGAPGADALHTAVEEASGGDVRIRGRRRVAYVDRTIAPVLDSVSRLIEELQLDDEAMAGAVVAIRPTLTLLGSQVVQLEPALDALPRHPRVVADVHLERLVALIEGAGG